MKSRKESENMCPILLHLILKLTILMNGESFNFKRSSEC